MKKSLLKKEPISLEVQGVEVTISAMYRPGEGVPIVFLHGFGSTKEDYADVAFHAQFNDRPLIAYDAPGCGETACEDLSAISISFLLETARHVLAHYEVNTFHVVGHSMGGLTALMLAHGAGERCLSFFNIEGNIAPEDCFLSRQILEFPTDDPQEFMQLFIERVWNDPVFSHPLFAASLPHKVRAQAVAPIFRSMVEVSDNEPLMEMFTGLHGAKMFVYGDVNDTLSYLPDLPRRGVQLAKIKKSGHFPMYANAPALWEQLGAFIDQTELELKHG